MRSTSGGSLRWTLSSGAGDLRRITDEQHARIVAVAGARPDTLGVPATRWSLKRLARYLREQRIVEISPAHLGRVLAAAGLSFQRTRTWKASILIPPRTPRWNGKIERFFRTLDTEWAHGRVWRSSTQRDRALASYIRFYNRQRPHSATDGRPPITRVH